MIDFRRKKNNKKNIVINGLLTWRLTTASHERTHTWRTQWGWKGFEQPRPIEKSNQRIQVFPFLMGVGIRSKHWNSAPIAKMEWKLGPQMKRLEESSHYKVLGQPSVRSKAQRKKNQSRQRRLTILLRRTSEETMQAVRLDKGPWHLERHISMKNHLWTALRKWNP